MSRTITVDLPDGLLRLVDEKATRAGLQRDVYIRVVLSKDVTGEPSISEIFAPFRDQVLSRGLSNDELDRLFSEARERSDKARSPSRNR
jgi:hypothetical protein